MKGFTLIELLIVIAVMGIVMAGSIASYTKYQDAQLFESGVSESVTMLQTAKSRAISQVKPTVCNGKILESYRVVIIPGGQNYTLSVVCSGVVYAMETRSLPKNVTFSSSSSAMTAFTLLKGTATASTITINGYGKTKTVTVNTVGRIGVN